MSLVRSLSASIEQIEWQARTVGVGDTEAHTASKRCTRVWRCAFEPWSNDSPWAGVLARAAEYRVA